MKRLIASSLFLSLIFSLSSPAANALSKIASQPPTGITVSPAFANVSITDSEKQVRVNFHVTNNEPYTQTINLSTADFNALNYTGGLLFVGSKATQLQKQYNLTHWLALPESSLILTPKQTSKVSVTINNTSDLAPGGHYGGLLFSVGGPSKIKSKNNIGVQPVASALMFVTKLDGATYKLGLKSASNNHNLFSLPSKVTLLFYDNGNTQITPRGYITLTSGNKLLSKGIINTDSALILPGNSRYLEVPLQKIAALDLAGNYKLTVNYTFDGISSYRVYITSAFYLSPLFILVLVIALIIIGYVIYKIIDKYKLNKAIKNVKPFVITKLKTQTPQTKTKVATVRKVKVKQKINVKSDESKESKVEIKAKNKQKAQKTTKKINITDK